MTEKEKYNVSFEFGESEEYDKAINGFLELLNWPKRETVTDFDIFIQLGVCYYFAKRYHEALEYYEKSGRIEDQDELASLGKYLSLVKLGETTKAVKELERYARKYPIVMYRDTLQELMLGILNNQGTDFKEIVLELAEIHDVTFDIEALKNENRKKRNS